MTGPPEGGLYAIDCEAAHRYGHVIGIHQDLEFSAGLLARLNEAVRAPQRDPELERGLWTAAVVFYARCFRKGRRYSLSLTTFDGRYSAPPGALEQHNFLMDIGQKDLGRSISRFEQSLAGVIVAPGRDGKPALLHAGALQARHHTRTPEGADKAMRHVAALRDYVREVIGKLAEEVVSFARQMPIEDIMKGGPMILAAPQVVAASTSRLGPMVRSIPGLD